MPKRRGSHRSGSHSGRSSSSGSGRGKRGRGAAKVQSDTSSTTTKANDVNQDKMASSSPVRQPPFDGPKVPLAEPVEQRWEETEGKYLHKKFKKMATAKATEDDAPPVPKPTVTSTSSVVLSPIVSSTKSGPPAAPLKHSALSMLPSPPRPTNLVNNQGMTTEQFNLTNGEVRGLGNEETRRTHTTNERPYPCQPCGFAFKTRSNLYKHQRSRTHVLKIERGIDSSSVEIMAELGEDGRAEIETAIVPAQVLPNLPKVTSTITAPTGNLNPAALLPNSSQITLRPVRMINNPLPSGPRTQVMAPNAAFVHRQRFHLSLPEAFNPGAQRPPTVHHVPLSQTVPTVNVPQFAQAHQGPIKYQSGLNPSLSLPPNSRQLVMQPNAPSESLNSRIRMENVVRHPASLTIVPSPQQSTTTSLARTAGTAQVAPSQAKPYFNPNSLRLPTTPLPMNYSANSKSSAPNVPQPIPQQTVPTDLSAKKVGPEALQQRIQRIDKVISENQAIVETLDPLWPRRYMRQNSKDGDEAKGIRCGRKYSLTCPTTLANTSISSGIKTVQARSETATSANNVEPVVPSSNAEAKQTDNRLVHEPTAAAPSVMIIRQSSASSASSAELNPPLNLTAPSTSGAQSVREVWINSCKKPVKLGNMAQLENIANALEGSFHPSNPEKSMIKELLIKTRDMGPSGTINPINGATISIGGKVPPFASTSTSSHTNSNGACVIEIKSQSAPMMSQTPVTTKPTFAELIHVKTLSQAEPLTKRPRLDPSIGAAQILTGGSVRSIEPIKSSPNNLLQIAKTNYGSGGSILSVKSSTVVSNAIPSEAIQTIVSSANFNIPGIPTPSLSGVLTGIKSTPLFSLPGKRLSLPTDANMKKTVESPVPFVLGMPGPFSQAQSACTSPLSVLTSSSSSTTIVTSSDSVRSVATLSTVPKITFSLAGFQTSESVSKLEPASPGEDSKFLRPSSLALVPGSFRQKKHVMMVAGATLVSPETPRPKKSYVLTYQNGTAYTHLGMKCSTRVYYCSVFRQQPMYVPQQGKLSMYSNWKVVSKDSHPSGLLPKESLNCYDSFYKDAMYGMRTIARREKKYDMIVAHSSQWKEFSKNKNKPTNEENSSSSPKPGTSKEKSQLQEDEEGETAMDEGDDSFTPSETRQVEGGYKTTDEDYTYVRGRGRGRYVCNSCGIRCKKPSMLKKHIRTHSNFRPHTCKYCNFSFKTKGNLTKHMKSKAHLKKCVELGINPVPTNIDEIQGSDSDSKQDNKDVITVPGDSDSESDDDENGEEDEDDDEQFEDADEDTAAAAQSLLSLGQQNRRQSTSTDALGLTAVRPKPSSCPYPATSSEKEKRPVSSQVSPFGQLYEYAKVSLNTKKVHEMEKDDNSSLLAIPQNTSDRYYFHSAEKSSTAEKENKTEVIPSISITRQESSTSAEEKDIKMQIDTPVPINVAPLSKLSDASKLITFGTKANVRNMDTTTFSPFSSTDASPPVQLQAYLQERAAIRAKIQQEGNYASQETNRAQLTSSQLLGPKTIHLGSVEIIRSPPNSGFGSHQAHDRLSASPTITLEKASSNSGQPMASKSPVPLPNVEIGVQPSHPVIEVAKLIPPELKNAANLLSTSPEKNPNYIQQSGTPNSMDDATFAPRNVTMNVKDLPLTITRGKSPLPSSFNSQCQLMAKDLNTIAQIKAASVANANFANKDQPVLPISGVLNAISPDKGGSKKPLEDKEMNLPRPSSSTTSPAVIVHVKPKANLKSNQDIMTTNRDGKPECGVCKKVFSKPSQLRLHSNIHYMERPFRCDDCAVSFRTKGHLVKHERSAGHFNKVNINQTFGAPSSSNPRPFQCNDCIVRFRIHGHLAKHLRSKIHIMKLECMGKLPIGIFAEMERLGTNLNEIDTADCNTALTSLQALAEKLYGKDPNKLPHLRMAMVNNSNSAEETATVTTKETNSAAQASNIKMEPSDTATEVHHHNQAQQILPTQAIQIRAAPNSVPMMAGRPLTNSFTDPKQDILKNHYAFNPSVESGRRISISSGPDERSGTDSETEPPLAYHASQPTPANHLTCTHCRKSFANMKSLHIHIYVDHQSSPGTSQPPPRNAAVLSPTKSVSNHPTIHNGELIAAARMVNLQQEQQRLQSPHGTIDLSHASNNQVSISREGSVASSSSDNEERTSFNCDLCGAVVPSRAAYKQHLLSHAAPRPFVCSKCDAGFTTSHQLEGHMKLH